MAEPSHTYVDAKTLADEKSSSIEESRPSISIGSGEFTRADRFTLLAAIGQGGMGELYAAYDAQLDRKVALKLVRADRDSDIADSRLLREAQALAKISHPNVVPVFDVGSAGRRVFVAMEYVRGQTLDAWIDRLDPEQDPSERVDAILRRFRDAALGLGAVHEAGLAHRDFKPDNVIVGDDGRVRLVDFGLARSTKPTDSEASQPRSKRREGELLEGLSLGEMVTPNIEVGKLTDTGALLGTPRYMAPEQWRAERGDSRSDQFSFCVALFHALYDTWPYAGETFEELRHSMLEGAPGELPREPSLSPRLRAALSTGLAREPEARSPDMSELLEAIDDMLEPRARSQSVLLAVLVALVVVLLAAVAKVSFPSRAPEGPDFERMTAELAREAEARQRWEQVAAQLATLDAEQAFAEGDQVFEAFAGLSDNADTLALAQGWLVQAERVRARGLGERQLAAVGESLLASPDWGGRREALLSLAEIQAADHDYRRLGATLLVLDDEGGRGEIVATRVAEAVYRRSLGEALELLQRPEVAELARKLGPLIRQLDQVTDTGSRTFLRGKYTRGLVRVSDLDEDGRDELLLLDEDLGAHLLAPEPSLSRVQELELPFESDERSLASVVRRPRSDAPSWVTLISPEGHALVELERAVSGQVEARTLVDDGVRAWVAGDLFSGPGWEGWEVLGSQTLKEMSGLRRLSSSPEPFVPEPPLAALDSYLRSMLVDDLDGDGQEELVVSADGWWAYDVRVLGPSLEPGSFELLARRKLGGNSGMVSFPAPEGGGRWLAVTVPEGPPAPRVFPASAPGGAEPGVYILAWAGPGSELELVDHLSLPTSFSPRVGDLDGDGRSELVVELNESMVILQPGEPLAETALWLSGLRCEEIMDLDRDGEHELIVSEVDSGELLVLGSGDAQLEPLAPPIDPRILPVAGLEPELRELWARAETLAMVGLLDQSSAAFARLASVASSSSALAARQRSAELLEREGSVALAAPLYEAAGDPSSLDRALGIYREQHQHADAARVAAKLAMLPDASPERLAQAKSLALRARPDSSLEFDLREPLDDAWRIAQPGLLRSEPRGLRIDLLNSPDPVLARRSFEWDGDHLKVDFDLDIERLEWGSMMHLDLVPIDASGEPEGERIVGVRVAATGGGGYYILDRHGAHELEQGSVKREPRMKAATPADDQRHLHISLDIASDVPSARVVVETSAEGSAPRTLAYQLPLEPDQRRSGRYELQITTGPELWMRGIVRLQRLGLAGAREDSQAAPLSRRERAILALANADSAKALELLEGPEASELDPRDRDWIAALALEQLGQWSEAQPLLEGALGDCEDAAAVARFAYGLLMVPDRFGPPLREFCPAEQFAERTWEVAWGALFHHPDLVDVHRTLTTQLPLLERCEPSNFFELRACADLLTARSRGWYMQNQGAAADTDLRRALELIEQWKERPELGADERRELLRLGSLAYVRLGAVLVIRNLFDEAEQALESALELDQAPEIIADVIVARSLFEPLHERPIWARVLRAQAGLE